MRDFTTKDSETSRKSPPPPQRTGGLGGVRRGVRAKETRKSLGLRVRGRKPAGGAPRPCRGPIFRVLPARPGPEGLRGGFGAAGGPMRAWRPASGANEEQEATSERAHRPRTRAIRAEGPRPRFGGADLACEQPRGGASLRAPRAYYGPWAGPGRCFWSRAWMRAVSGHKDVLKCDKRDDTACSIHPEQDRGAESCFPIGVLSHHKNHEWENTS